MLPGLIFAYEGVDGLKTGHTDFAGYAFTGTADSRWATLYYGCNEIHISN